MNTQKYIDRGYIDVDDDVFLKYSHEAVNCFGLNYTALRKSGADHPFQEDVYIWCPKLKHDDWSNTITSDGKFIEEECLDKSLAKSEAEKWRTGRQKRIVFLKDENSQQYHFVGLYQLIYVDDVNGSNVWKRISTKVDTYQPLSKEK